MNKNNSFEKILYWIVQISYAFLGCMALYFYKERLTTDTSYYFFKTLNTGRFWVEHQRIVLAIAEIPIWVCSKMGFPLQTIAMSFSVWHLLVFYLSGAFIYWRTKNVYAWLLLLLLQLIGIEYGFVCPIFEQFYGTAIGIIFYVELKQPNHPSISRRFFLFVLWLLLLLSHPFNLILGVYLLALDYVSTNNIKKYIPYLLLIMPLILFKKLTASEYETGKMNWIFDFAHNKTYQQLFTWDYYLQAGKYLLHYYWILGICFMALCAQIVISKKWKQLFVVLSFLLGSWLLINMSYVMIDYSGYNEQLYFLLVPLVLIPWVLDFLRPTSSKIFNIIILLLMVCTISWRIQVQYKAAMYYHARVERVSQWIKEARNNPGQKFYVETTRFQDIQTILGWDIPYFSILLSSLEPKQKTVSIFPLEEDNGNNLNQVTSDEYIFRNGEIEKIESLNKNYFRINQKSDAYKRLE